MAKIDEMLKELCPEGVEWKELVDVVKTITPPIKLKVDSYLLSGLFPIIDQSKDQIAGYTDDISNTLPDGQYILYGDHTLAVKYYDGRFAQGADGLKILLSKGSLPKYIYYCICAYNIQNNEYKRHWTQAKQIKLPIPPLPIQQHIVEVLDTFTDAINNLEEELALREKQFEFYREQLLAFDDESSLGGKLFSGKVEWKELQDVSSIVRGASPRPIKNFLSEKSEGIPWIKIGDADPNDKYIVSTAEFINKQGASKSRFLKKGSFILSNSMSFGRPYILAIDGCIHDGWIAISDYERQINADYLYYVLKTANVKKYWSMSANNGAVSNLNADIVRGTVIPIPSLCAQQDIVEILDIFEAMIANIKEEIALRTKQYEYYREKLLSFGK